jgi:hypothetical protein
MRERAFAKQQLAREQRLRAGAPPPLFSRLLAWLSHR